MSRSPTSACSLVPARLALLAERAVGALTATGRTLAVAESLTGGLVLTLLTDVPGASRVVRGGVVAYATDVKAELLGVEGELLADQGAVHPRVARQMAVGVRLRLDADLGLATTGVAGPTAQDGRAPGTVHVALSWRDGESVRSTRLTGGRSAIRVASAEQAVRMLLARLAADRRG